MQDAALRRIAALVTDLPPLPAVAQEALSLLSNPSTEPEELQGVLSRDAALSLKVLRLANSAYYRRKREISTLTSAILLLGFKTLHTLILSSAVHRVLSSGGGAAAALWDHCYAAALACRELARHSGWSAEQGEEAFLAGLFHDVGKGVIAAKFPGAYARPLGVGGEVESFGFHHGQLGEVLLTEWGIPAPLCRAAGEHHEPGAGGLGLLAGVADWLAWDVAPGIGAEPPAEPAGALVAMGLEGAVAASLRDVLAKSWADERSTYG